MGYISYDYAIRMGLAAKDSVCGVAFQSRGLVMTNRFAGLVKGMMTIVKGMTSQILLPKSCCKVDNKVTPPVPGGTVPPPKLGAQPDYRLDIVKTSEKTLQKPTMGRAALCALSSRALASPCRKSCPHACELCVRVLEGKLHRRRGRGAAMRLRGIRRQHGRHVQPQP